MTLAAVSAIRELCEERRYPFVIVMSSGERFTVKDSLMISGNAEYAHYTPREGPGKFLSMLQVTTVEPEKEQTG